MSRTTLPALLIFATSVMACAKASQPSNVVVAPMASGSSTAPVPVLDEGGSASAAPPEAGAGTPVERELSKGVETGAPPRFRACHADADCIAVPRVGCCHNGWMEAIASSQRDAYAASFVCPNPHPICAMYIVHDTREPKCDLSSGLCTMVPK